MIYICYGTEKLEATLDNFNMVNALPPMPVKLVGYTKNRQVGRGIGISGRLKPESFITAYSQIKMECGSNLLAEAPTLVRKREDSSANNKLRAKALEQLSLFTDGKITEEMIQERIQELDNES